MKKTVLSLLLLALTISLTACPGPTVDPNDVLFSPTIQANKTYHQQLTDFSGLHGDLVYFEISDVIKVNALGASSIDTSSVTLKVSHKNDEYFSRNRRFFSDSLSESSLDSMTISVVPNGWPECRGPCVIDNFDKYSSLDKVDIYVTNNNSYPVKLNIHSFVTASSDKNEPNSKTKCTTLVANSSLLEQTINPSQKTYKVSGAIETYGDIDCFKIPSLVDTITLETLAKNVIGARVRVFDSNTNGQITQLSTPASGGNDHKKLPSGKLIYVLVDSGNKAGPANHTSYSLTFK